MNTPEFCFYVKGSTNLIDIARLDEHGEYVGFYSGENATKMAQRHPGVQLLGFDAACTLIDDAQAAVFITAPVEITEERFWEMLEVLPPVAWHRANDCESFKLSERTCGHYTAIFARIGSKYFELSDDIRTPHEAIISKCRLAIELASVAPGDLQAAADVYDKLAGGTLYPSGTKFIDGTVQS